MHAALVLEDGSVWEGHGFGAETKRSGEVVFNTGMVGYVQSITDPSYYGQIICQTYPLAGNYGVSGAEFESDGPKIMGYVVSELCDMPSHHNSEMSLDEWLSKSGIPGIEGIDTRELTKVLRNNGTMLGILQVSREPIDTARLVREAANIDDPNTRDLVSEVTSRVPVTYRPDNFIGLRVVLIDCGVKKNIIRSLVSRGAEVIRVPASHTAEKILSLKPDGLFISNGPGDPKKAHYVAEAVRKVLEKKIPVMGICLGNQMLGLALGFETSKLKFGHRGQNHPAIDAETGRCYMTSQNHGYAVVQTGSTDKDAEVWFTNGNDGTVEGIKHKKLKAFGVQFHPEASPGPLDTGFLFDRFMGMMKHA